MRGNVVVAVIVASVSIIMVGYLAVGFAGYITYPTTIDSNVLKSFPYPPLLLKVSVLFLIHQCMVQDCSLLSVAVAAPQDPACALIKNQSVVQDWNLLIARLQLSKCRCSCSSRCSLCFCRH